MVGENLWRGNLKERQAYLLNEKVAELTKMIEM